jgi:anti-sigma factor (TIGR02949 family)
MKTVATKPNQVSADNGGQPDCEKIVSLLDIIIDGEASEEDRTYFFSHVETCQECFAAHQKHEQLKRFLRDNIQRKIVPTNLLSSIQSVIKTTA